VNRGDGAVIRGGGRVGGTEWGGKRVERERRRGKKTRLEGEGRVIRKYRKKQ